MPLTMWGALATCLLFLLPTLPVYSQDIPDLIGRVKPSVAFVLASGDGQSASGTAFVVHPEGLLVTALHVVEDAQRVTVTLPDGQSTPADVIGANSDYDLAILRIARKGWPALSLADSALVRQGEEVLIIGYPVATMLGNQEPTVTRGLVSAVRKQQGVQVIQVDAAMNPGVSGGPVINLRGEVIGVAIYRIEPSQQLNFASPTTAVKDLLAPFTGKPVVEFQGLRLPFTATQSVQFDVTGGSTANSSTGKIGAACLEPPSNGRSIIGLQGKLNYTGSLAVIIWLSLGRGVEAADPHSFGHLYGCSNCSVFSQMRFSVDLDSLELPSERVCASYTARAPVICIRCDFEARYFVRYKVRTVPNP